MSRLHRTAVLTLVVSLVVLAAAPAAIAVVTANDTRATATEIPTLPYDTTQNVADATAEESDPSDCYGEPHRTVWYSYTAADSGNLVLSTKGSSYFTVVSVFEQSGPTLTPIECDYGDAGDGAITSFPVVAGRTYVIAVGSGYSTGATWTLNLALRVQPDVDISLHAPAFVQTDTDAATITGVAQCSEPVTVQLPISLRQSTSAGTAYAESTSYLDCTTEAQLFSVRAPKRSTVDFTRGRAALKGAAQIRPDDVSEDISRSVLLRPCTQIGTVGDDALTGTPGKDRVCSLHGDDTVRTSGGYDVVYSGPGNDRIELGSGSGGGHAYGDAGDDEIIGGTGVELVYGGAGADVISLGGSRDRAFGEGGRDRISGGAAGDSLYGGDGADRLNGGTGSDGCVGGAKVDSFSSCEARTQ